MRQNLANSQG